MNKIIPILIIASLALCGCTENIRARAFGGTARIDLNPNEKVVTVTFKESDIWVLTRKRKPDEAAETLQFREFSSLGVLNGTVIINEK